jgi:hypothetical protein
MGLAVLPATMKRSSFAALCLVVFELFILLQRPLRESASGLSEVHDRFSRVDSAEKTI